MIAGGTPNYGRGAGNRVTIPALTTDVSTRLIPLSAIRDAAAAVYGAAIRTPLIRVELPRRDPERGAVSQARSAAADRLVQDPRRLQRRPPADAGAVERRRLDGQRRQRRAGRRARGAQGRRALLGDGDGHRAGDEDPRHRTARRVDRPRHLRRVLADGRIARLRSDDAATSCTRSTTIGSSPATRPPASRFSKTCPTSTRSSRRSAAAACSPASPPPCAQLKPDTRVYAAEPETAAPLSASLAAGRPVYFDNWTGVVRRRRRRQVGAARRCGRCSRRSPARSSSRSTRSRGR